MNLVAIGLIFPTILIYNRITVFLRPEYSKITHFLGKLSLFTIITILIVSLIVVIFHELIHGLFFWIYTRDRPVFAFKILYAFAAAPEWYIPRTNYIVIGLSPALLITVLSFLFIIVVPTSMLNIVSFAGIINFAGSTGDFIVSIWILTQTKVCLVRDSGDSFEIYKPRINDV